MPDKEQYKALLQQGFTKEQSDYDIDLSGFEIIKQLGQGGMSKVYLAYETALNRQVAIKVFQPGSLDASSLERFRQEAHILARIRHPNTIAVHGIFDEGKAPCMILEYVSGGDLRSLIQKEKKLTLQQALPIAIDICKGLEALHAELVIHRDINPSNILLTDKGQAIIADLGIALNKHPNAQTTAHTMTGTFVGTMAYLAPEQMSESRDNIDARADIWAVGVLLFEMLVGQPPQALLVSDLLKEAPSQVRPILKNCLRRDPNDRYKDIASLRADLENLSSSPKWKRSLLVLAPVVLLVLFLATQSSQEETLAPAQLTKEPETTTTTTESSPPLNATNTVNLLEGVNIHNLTSRGSWELRNETLRSSAYALGAYIALPTPVTTSNYNLELTIKRMWGAHSAVIYLPTASGMVNLDLDGWQQHISGIQNINGQDLRSHGDHFNFRFENGRAYLVAITVREEKISIFIDDQLKREWNIKDKSLTLTKHWRAPISDQIGLGAWNSRTEFRDIALEILQ